MSVARDLYAFKVKVFMGAIRSSRASMILIAIYVLGMLPSGIGMSLSVVNVVKSGIDVTAYVNQLAALLSSVTALLLLSAYRGYVAYEYEQTILFTSPIAPRTYLIVSLLVDLTVLSVFLLPLGIFLCMVIASLQLSILSTTLIVAGFVLFLFFAYFMKTSMSVLEAYRQDALVKIVLTTIILLLMLPAASLAIPFPIKYTELPYPSTLLAEILLNSVYGKTPSVGAVLGIMSYFLVSFAVFFFCSNLNLYQLAKPVPFVSPFDTSMRVQMIKTGKNIQFFSRFGFKTSLSLDSKSLQSFLMKKEFVRIVRDGSLFMVFMFYAVLLVISVATRPNETTFPMWMFLLAFYSFMVPAMLTSNWRMVELDNLWMPITSGLNFGVVAKAILYDFTLLAFAVPAATTVLLTFINHADPIVPLVLVASASIIGSSANLYTMISFLSRKRRATPALMINYAAMFLSGLLIAPTYLYAIYSFSIGLDIVTQLVSAVPVLIYSAVIFRILSKQIEKEALKIEI
jgi:hypothetical protein